MMMREKNRKRIGCYVPGTFERLGLPREYHFQKEKGKMK